MNRWTRAGLIIVLLAAAILATGWLMRGRIAMTLMSRAYERAMAANSLSDLPDGLSVGLCGSGAPLPDPIRAGPCTVVVAGRQMFVVDSGQGSTKTLSLMGLPPAQVSALFLTHYHSDHIADVGELMLQHWAGGAATSPLPVYGPTGLDQVVGGFEQAYGLDRGYRIAHHGPKVVPPSGFGGTVHMFPMTQASANLLLIDEPGLKVYAVPVNHKPVAPAVGYVFIYKGRKVVISGDTAPSPRLEAAAQGADVLVHEALSPTLVNLQREAALREGRTHLAQIFHDIISYHTTPSQAAAIAQRAHVRMLLLTHLVPAVPMEAMEGPFLGDARKVFHGRLRLGHDGDFVTLPAGSQRLSLSNRLKLRF
jgi:ribonuclease Z